MTKLNKRQRTFAEAYAIPGTEMYGNATKSAIHAGYSKKTAKSQGQRLLTNVELQEYIRGVEEKLFDEKIMNAKEILYRLSKTARGETVEIDAVVVKNAEYIKHPSFKNKHVLVYNEHIEVVEKPPKISDQNKALELLGKNYKLWTDKQEITQRNIEINIGEYDDTD
ncbi:terminase small subunit [Mammaliicoccus sciuri]|uniref:terminase small subunit n=1 Tax=Mammaliicoccus sciuri TaxID=1296 RepID=UPI001C4FE4C7|nr:terminase small subunit [Mammaliicoccus sciuri]